MNPGNSPRSMLEQSHQCEDKRYQQEKTEQNTFEELEQRIADMFRFRDESNNSNSPFRFRDSVRVGVLHRL
jgi:hypothetical protein